MDDLKNAIKGVIRGEVVDDPATLTTYSHDASLFEVKPRLVVRPTDADDISRLVRFVNDHPNDHLSLTARSAGTDMGGGPLTESIVVDMVSHFTRIKDVTDSQAVVEPGVFYRNFERATLRHHRIVPSYPASRELCTVGGMVANNSGGEKTLMYGKTADYLNRLKVVLSDGDQVIMEPLNETQLNRKLQLKSFEGEIYRKLFKLVDDNYEVIKAAKPHVSKNSAGYYLWNVWDRDKKRFDLTQLIVGSQGTLGLVTEITFRLIEPATHSRLLVIFLSDLEPLAEIVNRVLTEKPESFESYDDKTLELAMRFLPEIIHQMHAGGVMSLAWQFWPEFKMLITGGIPKLILMAEFTAKTDREARARAKAAEAKLADMKLRTHITQSSNEAKKYWTVRRESFSLLRHHIKGKHTAPFIDDIVVEPAKLPHFLPELQKILDQYRVTYTIAGHVGDGNFHIIPLMNFRNPDTKEIIKELSGRVYDLVFKYGGSMTGEHNDGLIRSPFLHQMYGDKIYGLFEEVKKIFDPHDIFNPGKKVNASFSYAMKHVVKS